MSVQNYLETSPLHEISRYAAQSDYEREGVLFSGTARKHPYDRQKLLLIPPPFATPHVLYEFRLSDILHAENRSNLVMVNGESLPMIDMWVRKGSTGIIMHSFEVGRETVPELAGTRADT
ncbi:MAG TPA: hypothetical protein VMW87_02475 [Spirochaetia bacterium]|nr:hypothetical protein [Spirochaetia bacterium]